MNMKPNTDTAAAVIEYVPLADLYLSDLNPRQEADPEGIALLAQSILTCGLVQNLAGLRDDAGRIGIVAGGRRLRALAIAAEQNPALALVPVRLASTALTAQAWANAENSAREALAPADEIRAYGRMRDAGALAPSIAKAFGVTEAHVYRRLKLADLPAPVMDALAAGQISLATAAAFTVSNDEALTLTVLDRVKAHPYYSEHQIKSLLTPNSLQASDRRALFVGLDAYEAAGGSLTRDLFSDKVFLTDPALLLRLFDEKLAAEAADLTAAGWKWVQIEAEESYISYSVTDKLIRLSPMSEPLTEAEAEEWDELAELADGDVLDDEGKARMEELDDKQAPYFTAEQKAQGGAWVYVDSNGKACTKLGYVRRADAAEAADAGIIAADRSGSADTAPAEKGPYSAKLIEDMKAVRLNAAQTALLSKPNLVLDLLAFALSPEAGLYHSILDIRTGTPSIVPTQEEGLKLDPRLNQRATSRNIDLGGAFAAFRAKGQKHRNAALTEAVARTLNYGCGGYDATPLFERLEDESGASIRAVWTPTAANFFGRVSGGTLDDLFKDLLEQDEDSPAFKSFRSLKKGAKAEAMEAIFADPKGSEWPVTDAQAAKIAEWVPDCA
ncbi:ParB/RepB/Spo0J family partition protein [Falsirhodobacter sp. 1013]|uniref:ParB/RepB/Spo0J family partition protein n=1 Tax=Falsirhodobacter sp. 1013 TaxID=3417566 RepID=UPI003EBCAF30